MFSDTLTISSSTNIWKRSWPAPQLASQLSWEDVSPILAGVKNIFLFIPCKTCSSEGLAEFFSLSALTAQPHNQHLILHLLYSCTKQNIVVISSMIVPLIPIAILIDDRCRDLSYAYNMSDNFSWGHEKLSGTVRMATTKKWNKSFTDSHQTSTGSVGRVGMVH